MLFSKQYKALLRKIAGDVDYIRNAVPRLFTVLQTIIDLINKQPAPSADPFDNLFILARFGGQVLKFKFSEDNSMKFTLKDDHPDVPFSVAPVTKAADAEGEPIAADQFTITDPVSDNEAAVSIVAVEGGGQAFHIGGPGTAAVKANLSYNGNVVKVLEADFTITTGEVDPASIVGGEFVIPDLTPDA